MVFLAEVEVIVVTWLPVRQTTMKRRRAKATSAFKVKVVTYKRRLPRSSPPVRKVKKWEFPKREKK